MMDPHLGTSGPNEQPRKTIATDRTLLLDVCREIATRVGVLQDASPVPQMTRSVGLSWQAFSLCYLASAWYSLGFPEDSVVCAGKANQLRCDLAIRGEANWPHGQTTPFAQVQANLLRQLSTIFPLSEKAGAEWRDLLAVRTESLRHSLLRPNLSLSERTNFLHEIILNLHALGQRKDAKMEMQTLIAETRSSVLGSMTNDTEHREACHHEQRVFKHLLTDAKNLEMHDLAEVLLEQLRHSRDLNIERGECPNTVKMLREMFEAAGKIELIGGSRDDSSIPDSMTVQAQAEAQLQLAYCLARLGLRSEAGDELLKTEAIVGQFEQLEEIEEDPLVSHLYANILRMYTAEGMHEQAFNVVEKYEKSLQSEYKRSPAENLEIANSYASIGAIQKALSYSRLALVGLEAKEYMKAGDAQHTNWLLSRLCKTVIKNV